MPVGASASYGEALGTVSGVAVGVGPGVAMGVGAAVGSGPVKGGYVTGIGRP